MNNPTNFNYSQNFQELLEQYIDNYNVSAQFEEVEFKVNGVSIFLSWN